MKSILIGLGSALLLVTVIAFGSQKQDQVERQLKSAMNTELVDGNLKSAIEQYKKVADSGFRPLAAQALIHMAECYQRLGDAESQKVYQRIINDYKDQKDALALAQARLGGSGVTGTKGDRLVWTGPKDARDPLARVSPNGRFITFVDWTTGSLMIHDIAANLDHVLTRDPKYQQYPKDSRISTDGKQIVYQWSYVDGEFRIASLAGNGFLEPRTVFVDNDEVYFCGSFDWSPDRKWIATASQGKAGTHQIALISVADGSFKILKATNGDVPERIFFSPDSKTIAYDLPAGDGTGKRDVSVLTIDGGREVSAVVRGAISVMGWSPDGTRLLFSSDRTGTVGLWALPFSDWKVQGPSELLKPDIGTNLSMGVTDSGTLYVYKQFSSRDIAIASIDLNAGKLLGPPVSFAEGFVEGPGFPMWSPDGRYLAYNAAACSYNCFAIRSVATGQVRRLPPTLSAASGPNWSPDGRSLLVRGKDLRGRTGIFQIDVQSGEATAVFLSDGLAGVAKWSPDGKKVYFNRSGKIVERDLASGMERDVYEGVAGGLSPDGKGFPVVRTDPSTKTASLLLIPVTGGPPRELLRLTQPEVINPASWTPDSTSLIIQKEIGSRKELWLIPVTGGSPRKLDIDPDIWLKGADANRGQMGFSLSPDGHSIAFQVGKTVSEVWALENFLPAPTVKK